MALHYSLMSKIRMLLSSLPLANLAATPCGSSAFGQNDKLVTASTWEILGELESAHQQDRAFLSGEHGEHSLGVKDRKCGQVGRRRHGTRVELDLTILETDGNEVQSEQRTGRSAFAN